MDVVLKINGREALAVWTIPYMTSWWLSPDMLLERLTSTASRFPQAFNLDRNGNPIKLTHSQWDELENLVNKLENHLSDLNIPEHEDRLAWVKESIELFWHYEPSYLWRDEFEDWYYNLYIANTWAAEPSEDTRLSFNPQLPPEHIKHFEQNDFKSATSATAFDNQSIEQFNEIDQATPVESEPEAMVVSNTAIADNRKPWQIPDPRDPDPEYPWYIPARYFARQLIEDDSTLLTKRKLLAGKVSQSLGGGRDIQKRW